MQTVTTLFRFCFLLLLGTSTTSVYCRRRHLSNVLPAIPLPLDEPGDSNTVPALPVEWQGKSCQLDLNNQLFGGVKEACSTTHIKRRRCCPVLAAWLIAARAKVSLQVPAPAIPGMPLLPDDSMVCIANLEASLESKGLHLTSPNASCDVVTCFCGIRLGEIKVSKCPTKFFDTSSSQRSSLTVPHHASIPSNNGSLIPSGAFRSANSTSSASLQALEANCTDHSYRGCTKCLVTLQQITGRRQVLNKTESLDCELLGLMWLLENNKTFYIPTVSAVLRALLYGEHSGGAGSHCSPDWANMPLAVDSAEIQQSSLATSWSSRKCFYFLCWFVFVVMVL